jgi:L-fucose isomerase-like protein
MNTLRLGFIPAHRNLMDKTFSIDRRRRLLKVLKTIDGIDVIAPDESLTDGGLVSNDRDALKVLDLFSKAHVDGLVIGVLGYGDEKSTLSIVEHFDKAPLLLFSMKEPVPDGAFFEGASFCGSVPISYGLHKRNRPFTYAGFFDPEEDDLRASVQSFKKVCGAIKRFRGARVGLIGQRPSDFEVCAVNEGLMIERYHQKIIPFNLVDLKSDIENIKDNDERVKLIIGELAGSFKTTYQASGLLRLAKLEVKMAEYAREQMIDAFAIQCWTSMQKHLELTPCAINGRMTHAGIPVACEGDVLGSLSMLVQQELTMGNGTPLFLDLLMPHPQENNLVLAWHCGNAAVELKAPGEVAMLRSNCSFEKEFGADKSAASAEFRIKPGLVTVNRLVEHGGTFKMLNFEGVMTAKKSQLRGAWAWIELEKRDDVLRSIVENGFTHHVSIVHESLSAEMKEFCKYLAIRYVPAP